MGRLVFALRADGSLLFATDAPAGGGGPNNGTIASLDEKLIGAVHTDTEPHDFGPTLLTHLVKNSPPFSGDVLAYSRAAGPILSEFCSGRAVPQVGLIFGGFRKVGAGERAQLVGVHVQRSFGPLEFPVNVFGGPTNAIARYLDQKISGPVMSLALAKELAAWHISQTRIALPGLIEESCCLVALSASRGLSWVSADEIEALSSKNIAAFARLRMAAMSLFGQSAADQ